MIHLYDCVFLKQGMAFGIGAAIYLVTTLLVARKVIGFTLSVAFLLIALGVSMGIKYHDSLLTYWQKGLPKTNERTAKPESVTKPESTSPSTETTPTVPQEASRQPSSVQPRLGGQNENQKDRIRQFMNNQEV